MCIGLPFSPAFMGLSGTESNITKGTVFLLNQSRMMMDDDECGAFGGMIGRGNRSTGRRRVPVPLCPPQIPHVLTRDRTRASALRSRRVTAWTRLQDCFSYDPESLVHTSGWKVNLSLMSAVQFKNCLIVAPRHVSRIRSMFWFLVNVICRVANCLK
jgi:hypothetical protein